MTSFSTVNLGCKVNRVETDQAAAFLLSCGLVESSESEADVILVNTCTVTAEADKKTRKAVRHALRANDRAEVVVTGCASAIDADTFLDMAPGRVTVVPKMELQEFFHSRYQPASGCECVTRMAEGFRQRVGVKIQDGCNNACTYCIVHVARGRSVSVPAADVFSEVDRLVADGAREIVLTGINLGTYRWDDATFSGDLSALLRELLRRTENVPDGVLPRFRISSIEPKNVDDRLIELMAASDGRICRHLHLPLQSGSSKVLREMARPYHAEFFLGLVGRLRAAMPSLALSTDIIAGFPGETENDFQETLAVAEQSCFMKIHSFPYSLRAGTLAARRTDQVPSEVKAERAARLRDLSDQLCAQDLKLRAGTTELALVEPGGVATCESYHVVPAPVSAREGALVPVVL